MNEFLTKLNAAIKVAMKSKDNLCLTSFRNLKSYLDANTSKNNTYSEDDINNLIKKYVIQRIETANLYKGKNDDLANSEYLEGKEIAKFLPIEIANSLFIEKYSDEELQVVLKDFITRINMTNMKQMGQLMGLVNQDPKIDKSKVSKFVQQILASS